MKLKPRLDLFHSRMTDVPETPPLMGRRRRLDAGKRRRTGAQRAELPLLLLLLALLVGDLCASNGEFLEAF